jgi:DNA-binding transcriptional ArsR family regulator
LLLETLLFEQVMMVDVFAAKDSNAKLSADADAAAGLMSFALSMHELGHFYMATKPGLWEELVQTEPDTIGSLYVHVTERYPADFATEFQCDVHAVIGCLRQYESHAGAAFALRALAFAFAAYAAASYELCMHSAPGVLFKTLADPTRRAIFERLTRDGEQTVRVLTDQAGVSQPAVSKHLGVLRLAGLVRDRREGRQTHYRAAPQGLVPLIDWMSLYGAFWRDRFDRLETLLNRMDQ